MSSHQDNLERIKEVLDLKAYRLKKKKEFRRWLLSIFLGIILIVGAIYYYINYG